MLPMSFCQILGQCEPTFDHDLVIWLEICMVIGWLSLNRYAGIMINTVKCTCIDHLAHWRVSDLAFLGYFLAHLSRGLMGELIVYQSLRRPSVCPSTISNIFSSETTGPIKFKFHMETSLDAAT